VSVLTASGGPRLDEQVLADLDARLADTDAFRNTWFEDLGSSVLRVDLNILALPGSDGDLATPVSLARRPA